MANTALQRQPTQSAIERKVSSMPFENYLNNWAEHIKKEQQKLRKLTEMAVILHRRYRGLTISDMCSAYGTRPTTKGIWIEYDAVLDGEARPINIVQPAMRANTSACLQSNVSREIESANASAKNKKIAERWQRVSDYLYRTTWTEAERTILFDAVQKEGTNLLEVAIEQTDSENVPSVNATKEMIAQYSCAECQSEGMKEFNSSDVDDTPEEGEHEITCPECGGQAMGIVKAMDGFELEESAGHSVKISREIVPFFNFVIDSYGAKSKGIDGAKWLQIHGLCDRAELEAEFPQFEFGSPEFWSYQPQCGFALASADWSYLNGSRNGSNGYAEFDRFEERAIYLHEDSYRNYRSPSDFPFVNGRGEQTFNIKTGETIAEAQIRQFGKNLHGFKFVWINERLRDIPSAEKEIINFRDRFTSVHWLRDSSGFNSAPYWSIASVQDDITLYNTMDHNITAQNAVVPVYYDSLAFEEKDFSKSYVGTKNSALLDGKGLKDVITTLPAPTPSPHLANRLQFLWSIKDEISQVQPAMRGDAQKGETFAAQRQQLEQSYGLLTPVLKSFAQALVTEFRQQAKVIKDHWTLKDFQKVSSMYGEVWTDEDVQEMCEVDFDADLIIDYRQGSEMPQSNFSRELKFAQGLSQLMPLLQIAPNAVDADKFQKIIAKLDEYGDFDFDLTGLEVDELISQKRIIELTQISQQYEGLGLVEIEEAKTKIIGMDEMGEPISALDTILEQIFNQSAIRFSKYENLEQQGKTFTEALKSEIGREKPNYLLIELLQTVLALVEEAINQMKTEAMQNSPEAQLAAEQERKLLEQQNAQIESAKTDEESKAQAAKEQQMAEKVAGHQMTMEQKDLDHQSKMAQIEAQTEGQEQSE